MFRLVLLFLVLPLTAYSDKHIPYYKSLAHDKSWLRHYPENQDLNKQTEKFLLTEENMPVKVIEEFRNSWSSYTDWYRIELFNGIQGWIAHNQLSKKRTLLILKDIELYAEFKWDRHDVAADSGKTARSVDGSGHSEYGGARYYAFDAPPYFFG